MNTNITDNQVLRDFCFKLAFIEVVQIYDKNKDQHEGIALVPIDDYLLSQNGFKSYEELLNVLSGHTPSTDKQSQFMLNHEIRLWKSKDDDIMATVMKAFWQAVAVLNYAMLDKDVAYQLIRLHTFRNMSDKGEKQDV